MVNSWSSRSGNFPDRITFAKLMPEFRKLNIDDQMALLRGSAMEIFICTSQSLFDDKTQTISDSLSKERDVKQMTQQEQDEKQQEMKKQQNLKLEMLKFMWPLEIYTRTIKYLKSMIGLNIDETTLVLYIPLILFAPDRRGLKDQARIFEIQSKYSVLLQKYLNYKFQNDMDRANKLYTTLILKLIDLRDLHELHSSILIDADPSQLELYSHAILNNDKEEMHKVKSANNLVSSTANISNSSVTYSPPSINSAISSVSTTENDSGC